MSRFPNRERLFIIFLLVWMLCSGSYLSSRMRSVKNSLRLLPLSIEQKYTLLDGQLYKYVKFLRTQIPEDATVVFINNTKDLKRFTPEWVKSVYDENRVLYYLYPRIFVLSGTEYSKKDSYKIVYNITPTRATLDLYYPGQEINVAP